MMEGEEGDLSRAQERRASTGPDAEADRKPRSEEEMRAEAEMLRREMDGVVEGGGENGRV